MSETTTHTNPSLLFSCFEKPFLSISASTPKRDGLPTVSLSMSDPSGQGIGPADQKENFSEVRYGPVIEIPKLPQQSLAIALEICGAKQGIYEMTITESGKGQYRLAAGASIPDTQSETIILRHVGHPGRVWHYRLSFRYEADKIVLRWLDKSGVEQYIIEVPEW